MIPDEPTNDEAKAKPAARKAAKAAPAAPAAPAAKPAAKKAAEPKAAAARKPAAKKKPAKPAKKEVVAKKQPAAKKPPAKKKPASRRAGAKSSQPRKTLRIRLRGFDHRQVDQTAMQIVRAALHSGAVVSGPIPLPVTKVRYDLLRSPHVDKDSREQVEIRTYHRVIDVHNPESKTVEAFQELQISHGVKFNMKERQC